MNEHRLASCFGRRIAWSLAAALYFSAAVSVAQESVVAEDSASKRFEAHSGRDPNHYPPDRPVDFIHLRLELTFDDLMSRSFVGRALLTLRPVHKQVTTLTLDAVDLHIRDLHVTGGGAFRFDYDDRQLVLNFAQPLPVNADTVVTIDYHCVEPIEGMIWALPDEAYPDRPLVIHTQGEPEFARYWFPCLDSPVDRCTSEIIATIPSPFIAVSNGKLIEKVEDVQAGRTTFHYRQEQPHVSYLVSLVIGRFNEVKDRWRGIDVQYFLPPGRGEFARLTYGRTPEMLEYFSNLLGFDYPYAKYSQVNVPLFFFGGMENTSATTMTDTAILTPRAAIDQDLEGLISHELAHQWFGDLITCRSWKHLWLNEGFATFMASVWKEKSKGREDYLYDFWKRFQHVAKNDSSKKQGAGVLFADYRHPSETFSHKGSLPYAKGSCVLHMLRHELGEELFWRSMATYVRTYANREVETNDLRRVFEAVTGRNLEQFFTQWLSRTGVIHLDVKYRWDPLDRTVTVAFTQDQTIDQNHPAFNVPVDLYFRAGDQELSTTIHLNERRDAYRRKFDKKPELFCVDPNAGLLMKLDCDKPKTLWLAQLDRGPTAISRSVAAKHLARYARPEVAQALRDKIGDQAEHWSVRGEAAAALGAMRSNRAKDALLSLLSDEAAMADHKVRRAAIGAAGRYDAPEVGRAIARFAASDPSSKVEASATKALGNVRSFDAQDLLVENADKESFQFQIRIAAIEALAERNDPKAVEVAMKYASYGRHDRVRSAAIRSLGRIARDNLLTRDEVRTALIRWLTDPQDRVVRASIEALGDVGDAESKAALRQRMDGAIKPQLYYRAVDALARTRPDAESQSLRSLREELQDLREQLHRLQDHPESSGVSGNPK